MCIRDRLYTNKRSIYTKRRPRDLLIYIEMRHMDETRYFTCVGVTNFSKRIWSLGSNSFCFLRWSSMGNSRRNFACLLSTQSPRDKGPELGWVRGYPFMNSHWVLVGKLALQLMILYFWPRDNGYNRCSVSNSMNIIDLLSRDNGYNRCIVSNSMNIIDLLSRNNAYNPVSYTHLTLPTTPYV